MDKFKLVIDSIPKVSILSPATVSEFISFITDNEVRADIQDSSSKLYIMHSSNNLGYDLGFKIDNRFLGHIIHRVNSVLVHKDYWKYVIELERDINRDSESLRLNQDALDSIKNLDFKAPRELEVPTEIIRKLQKFGFVFKRTEYESGDWLMSEYKYSIGDITTLIRNFYKIYFVPKKISDKIWEVSVHREANPSISIFTSQGFSYEESMVSAIEKLIEFKI